MEKPITPAQAARDLIEYYVLRGDSYESLRAGSMGSFSPRYSAQIGGWLDGRHYGTDKILVSKVNGEECALVFQLKYVYERIKERAGQPALF